MSARIVETRIRPWRDPLGVANGLKHLDGPLALLSDGGALGRRSFVAAEPDEIHIDALPADGGLGPPGSPGFSAGVVGLLAYDAGARAATGPRPGVWPDLMLARYPAMLAFDHRDRSVSVIGRGHDPASARAAAERAESWLAAARDPVIPAAPAERFESEAAPGAYIDAVSDVVDRIAAGELFQANIARAWSGKLAPDADPFDVMLRLSGRAAAYGAFWRLGDLAIVSNSPELFLTFDPDSRRIETRPIKGTRRRDPDRARDAALAAELEASAKDRAENLMIVDLMRNDLARVAEPGSVTVDRLFEIESHPTVHHLVSSVSARARDGVGPADLLAATFPPGSITGAPKHQAMKVIAGHEAPRGPWCGTLFHIEDSGRLTASVLIRTASFRKSGGGWSFRALAGAGIVADSEPEAELAETDAKILALREALTG
ncbi:anthranilate synthase component I family protein [Brevundimonas sp.]|uniref:anthranilate synthase component I family protein n=1 Tax=Brevundimonas sp. TaxID=1871086 RepID=UPI002BAD08C2|nr:chorismate-binding protein [Brevundimonas sp.]HWQ87244.1 chorismate-binding protein [Brevundimonas sp.]